MAPITRFSVFAVALLFFGCGPSGPTLYEVTGTIKLKGQPLDNGVITFNPVDPNGKTVGSTVVTKGSFKIPKAQGLTLGKYRVSVTAPDGKTPDADPNAMPGPSGNFTSKDRIPAKYNINSTIEFEVVDSKPNVFTLEIP